ncbi:hypothetical protein BpHYR1_040627 [Brachionus plicatilis]|uniref:Uncharacterized protein n=1 Tax=Brachionus plicatilis TaxID=10195 RepID=A0A3M7RZ15_BRAPC|nr:hypothetical protein BpHYR1_040627 [Brachionus plicatilis]
MPLIQSQRNIAPKIFSKNLFHFKVNQQASAFIILTKLKKISKTRKYGERILISYLIRKFYQIKFTILIPSPGLNIVKTFMKILIFGKSIAFDNPRSLLDLKIQFEDFEKKNPDLNYFFKKKSKFSQIT